MRAKNYGDLSAHVFNEVEKNLGNITEVLVRDTYSPATEIIDIDLKSLIHKAIMAKLGDFGSINNREFNREGYSNGLAIDLEEIKIRIDNQKMFVSAVRGDIAEIE